MQTLQSSNLMSGCSMPLFNKKEPLNHKEKENKQSKTEDRHVCL